MIDTSDNRNLGPDTTEYEWCVRYEQIVWEMNQARTSDGLRPLTFPNPYGYPLH